MCELIVLVTFLFFCQNTITKAPFKIKYVIELSVSEDKSLRWDGKA